MPKKKNKRFKDIPFPDDLSEPKKKQPRHVVAVVDTEADLLRVIEQIDSKDSPRGMVCGGAVRYVLSLVMPVAVYATMTGEAALLAFAGALPLGDLCLLLVQGGYSVLQNSTNRLLLVRKETKSAETKE